MKLIWYLTICFTIFLILINSPKATSLGNFRSQRQIVNFTRGAQKKIQIITIFNVLMFFVLTIFFVLYSST